MFLKAFKTSLPALACYLPLGIVYGVLCSQQGYPWYYAPLFSFFVLAGAMQFLALTLLSAGSSIFAIALALIPLGLRNIFYGLTMLERYKRFPYLLRLYLAHGLIDATYSLLNTGEKNADKENPRFIISLTVMIHASWVLGSLVGSFILNMTALPDGLAFSLTAFFAAAAMEQFLSKKEYKPILIAAISIVVAQYLAPQHFFLTAITIAIVTCLALPPLKKRWV